MSQNPTLNHIYGLLRNSPLLCHWLPGASCREIGQRVDRHEQQRRIGHATTETKHGNTTERDNSHPVRGMHDRLETRPSAERVLPCRIWSP